LIEVPAGLGLEDIVSVQFLLTQTAETAILNKCVPDRDAISGQRAARGTLPSEEW